MNYKYMGLELTPNVFAELLIALFDGKQFSRQDAIAKITKYHSDNGGLINKTSYISVFKAAAQSLKKSGLENIGYGIWKLNHEIETIEVVLPENRIEISYSADKELGSGNNSVYVYYYNCYQELAVLKGNNHWECKIGRTDIEPLSRVFGQAGTSYPELPHLALIIFCDDSSLLEKAIHSVLKLQGKWLSNAPGREWFLTSPEEIEKIYLSIID